jgi:hypothetical protein
MELETHPIKNLSSKKKLNCFKRFFRFWVLFESVLWKFKVTVNEIKVGVELEGLQMSF